MGVFATALEGVSRKVQTAVEHAAEDASRRLVETLRSVSPVATGEYQDCWDSNSNVGPDGVVVTVGNTCDHAQYVEERSNILANEIGDFEQVLDEEVHQALRRVA
jgi:hypothetical protein